MPVTSQERTHLPERAHRPGRSHCRLTQALPAQPRAAPRSGAPDRPVSAQLPVAPGGFWCGRARPHDGHSDACAPHEVVR